MMRRDRNWKADCDDMGHSYQTGEIGVEHTSHVITLPDGKRR
jgi:hypothetical protein